MEDDLARDALGTLKAYEQEMAAADDLALTLSTVLDAATLQAATSYIEVMF